MVDAAFTFQPVGPRVLFGWGRRAELAAELQRLGIRRPLVLSTPGQADTAQQLAAQLGTQLGHQATTLSIAAMHTPVEVTEQALAALHTLGADGLVAYGGGSSTGLSKALALRTDLPQVILPTTYAGSEMTAVLGQTENGQKTTQRSEKVQPETVIYDVELTLGLPVSVSMSSGLNALAHAVEGMYAVNANPLTSLMGEEAIRALSQSLPHIRANPKDRSARTEALYGAWLAGSVLAQVEMALHHKLAHVLGGTFGLPHAELHAALLPHTTAYNAAASPEAMRRIARALGTAQAAQGLYELNQKLGIESALSKLGMPESGIAQAADLATAQPYPNPAPLEKQALLGLLTRAWSGEAPKETP